MNLALVRRSDGQVDVTVLLPGRTRQAPPVQRRATLEVLARASGPACRERRIVDTEIVERRGDVSVEHWTVEACGERRAFEVALETRAGELVALDIKDADGER